MNAAPPQAESPMGHAAPLGVVVGTALAYALVGAAALLLAGPPGYASPLYPSAGIALAVVLCYGRFALLGVLLGSFAVNAGLGLMRGTAVPDILLLSLIVGTGAALQAGVGAALVRRFVSMPLVLNAPRDVVMFSLLGALLSCGVSPSVGIAALWAHGLMAPDVLASNWATWWVGDSLGVLIAAPLVLTLVGRPRADWKARRRTVGIPLLLALGLLAVGMNELNRVDQQRLQSAFERDADRLAAAAEIRLAVPLYALQALRSAMQEGSTLDADTLQSATRWWLAQKSSNLLAMGYSERVALDALSAFEADARAAGLHSYRVFDRDEGAARARDGEVLALRLIEPAAGNLAALGVNTLSIPAARAAALASRDSGEPSVTAGFRLTQASGDETGVVIYQALYRGDAGPDDDLASRRARFSGVVFVTVPTERALAGLGSPQPYLRWCLIDADPHAPRPRLAGPRGCEDTAAQARTFHAKRDMLLAGHPITLRITAAEGTLPGRPLEATWMLSLVGLASAALLGTLLLTVTGHSRRTELAVTDATAELRREMDDRNAAELALRESEARLRSIVDHVPLGIMFLDMQGVLIDCNPQLAAMAGTTVELLRGRAVTDIVPAEDMPRIRALRRALLDGSADGSIDKLRLRCLDGQDGGLVRVGATALRAPDGRMLRMVGVVEDITEHLRLMDSERALQRAEAANRAKSDFLSRMSHELRTPLNAMIGFAQLLGLDREPRLAAHQDEWTQQIQRAGWHLLEMINETLDLARIESGSIRLVVGPLALQPLVSACCAMLATPASQQGIRIEQSVAPDAASVLGDAMRLKQVLTNLLSNAVKYNVSQGKVTITARRVSDAKGNFIEINVTDTGLGMTPEQQASLFQPYNRLGREQTAIEGTGIGLVISRRLVELMEGTLEARSSAGQGSVFTLRLPAPALEQIPTADPADAAAPYNQRLVHYVEDNETNIEIMRGIFMQRPQIRFEVSMLGLDGLTAIRATRPDLVLLDMHLPDISGLELLRHIKQDDSIADIPVVVVSADATPMNMQSALTSGALRYITKPLDLAQMLQIVDDVLEAAETRWG